jgi:hypothetical protein
MLRATLSSLWLFAIPKEPFGLVLLYPATILAAGYHFWHSSQQGLRLIGLAALWDFSVGAWLMIASLAKRRNALVAALVELKDCEYTPVGLEQFITAEQTTFMHKMSTLTYLGTWGLPIQHEDSVEIYLVSIGQSATIPDSLGSFNLPFLGATLLIRDHPEDAEVSERFFFWHEIGHTLGAEFALQSGLFKGVKSPLTALVLSLFVLGWNAYSLVVLLMCFVAIGSLFVLLAQRRTFQRIVSEMRADEFALKFLSPEDARYIEAHSEKLLPIDREFSEREHNHRATNIRRFVRSGKSFVDDQLNTTTFFVQSALLATSLIGWMVLLSRYISYSPQMMIRNLKWLLLVMIIANCARYVFFYGKGFFVDFILSGRIRWIDGKFKLQRPVPRG